MIRILIAAVLLTGVASCSDGKPAIPMNVTCIYGDETLQYINIEHLFIHLDDDNRRSNWVLYVVDGPMLTVASEYRCYATQRRE